MSFASDPKAMHVVSLLLLVLLLLLWRWWRDLEVLKCQRMTLPHIVKLTSGWVLGSPAPVCSQGEAASAKLLFLLAVAGEKMVLAYLYACVNCSGS
jgi:hypothetical protein